MRSTRWTRAAAVLVVAAPWHSVAAACSGPHSNVGFLHRSLPADGKYEVAVEVEISALRAGPILREAEGRILSLIRGNYAGTRVIVRNLGLTSCDSLPSPGQKGIILGKIISSSPDALIIDPIRTLSEREIFQRTGKWPTD